MASVRVVTIAAAVEALILFVAGTLMENLLSGDSSRLGWAVCIVLLVVAVAGLAIGIRDARSRAP